MTLLCEKNCRDLAQITHSLSSEEIQINLAQIDKDWQLDANSQCITKKSGFKNYYETMAFVNVIAQIAHQQDHHPDLHISYNHCTITFSTHSAGGLTLKDFICAAKVDRAQQL